MLHPGPKLEYFRQQDWEDEWATNAEELARDEPEAHYDGKHTPVVLAADAATPVNYNLISG